MVFDLPSLGVPLVIKGASTAISTLRRFKNELIGVASIAGTLGSIGIALPVAAGIGAARLGYRGAKGLGTSVVKGMGMGAGMSAFQLPFVAVRKLAHVMSESHDRAIQSMIKQWGKFKEAVLGIITTIVRALAPLVQGGLQLGTGFLKGVGSSLGNRTSAIREIGFKFIEMVQKAVAAFLDLIADARDALMTFRQSRAAGWMGFSKPSEQAIQSSQAWSGVLRSTASRFRRFDFRAKVQPLIQSAFIGNLFDIFKTIGTIPAFKNNYRNATGLASSLGSSALGGLADLRGKAVMGALKTQFGMFKVKPMKATDFQTYLQVQSIDRLLAGSGGLNMSSLTATESGSREGFGQRVRSMRESEVLRVERDQLDVLRAIRHLLAQTLANPPDAADFGGMGL